jgi:3-dehydroquinate synthase
MTGLVFNESEFTSWLVKLGYQVTLPDGLSPEHLLNRMKQDKKSVGQKVRFVLLDKVGNARLYEISDDVLLKDITDF